MNEQAREHETDDVNEIPADESIDESAIEAQAAEELDPLAELQKERDELYARLQRVSADYQNFMRRSETNLVDSIHLASGDVLKRFVPVMDHFDTALGVEANSDDAKALHDGFRIVRDELMKVLQQAGVERLDPQVGEPFDPHCHEAMLQQPAEGVEPGCIAQVFQPGYVYKNRTLRAAKVAVVPE